MDICGMNVRILTSNKILLQLMEIYRQTTIYLTEQRSGMRWPVKLKGFKTAIVSSDEAPPGCKGGKGLQTNLGLPQIFMYRWSTLLYIRYKVSYALP